MATIEPDISVRELEEFARRSRVLEGIKGHKRIQQSRGKDYGRPLMVVEIGQRVR